MGDQSGSGPHAGSGSGCLTARVAAADDNDIEMRAHGTVLRSFHGKKSVIFRPAPGCFT
jgi:hypothetical protein